MIIRDVSDDKNEDGRTVHMNRFSHFTPTSPMPFWGRRISPQEPLTVSFHKYPQGRLRITQATLGDLSGWMDNVKEDRSVLTCKVSDDQEVIYLCSLRMKHLEMAEISHEFDGPNDIILSVKGRRDIHVVGYFYDVPPDDNVAANKIIVNEQGGAANNTGELSTSQILPENGNTEKGGSSQVIANDVPLLQHGSGFISSNCNMLNLNPQYGIAGIAGGLSEIRKDGSIGLLLHTVTKASNPPLLGLETSLEPRVDTQIISTSRHEVQIEDTNTANQSDDTQMLESSEQGFVRRKLDYDFLKERLQNPGKRLTERIVEKVIPADPIQVNIKSTITISTEVVNNSKSTRTVDITEVEVREEPIVVASHGKEDTTQATTPNHGSEPATKDGIQSDKKKTRKRRHRHLVVHPNNPQSDDGNNDVADGVNDGGSIRRKLDYDVLRKHKSTKTINSTEVDETVEKNLPMEKVIPADPVDDNVKSMGTIATSEDRPKQVIVGEHGKVDTTQAIKPNHGSEQVHKDGMESEKKGMGKRKHKVVVAQQNESQNDGGNNANADGDDDEGSTSHGSPQYYVLRHRESKKPKKSKNDVNDENALISDAKKRKKQKKEQQQIDEVDHNRSPQRDNPEDTVFDPEEAKKPKKVKKKVVGDDEIRCPDAVTSDVPIFDSKGAKMSKKQKKKVVEDDGGRVPTGTSGGQQKVEPVTTTETLRGSAREIICALPVFGKR